MKLKPLLFIVLILLAGCNGNKNSSQSVDVENVYKGTDGMITQIETDTIPDKVYEGESFDMVVKVTNKGPIGVSDAQMLIVPERGYVTFDGGSNTKTQSISLEGKEQFQTIDDFKVFSFRMHAGQLEPMSESHSAIVSVNTCYDYVSKVYADICIDTDPHNIRPGEKPCSTSTISTSSGQGGPVKISRIEPRMVVDGDNIKPQLKIYIENAKSGSVTRYGQVGKYCSNQALSTDDFNKISASNVEIGLSGANKNDFNCIPGEIWLKGESDYITCTMQSGVSNNIDPYLTPIYVELKYGYMESEAFSVPIKKLTGI